MSLYGEPTGELTWSDVEKRDPPKYDWNNDQRRKDFPCEFGNDEDSPFSCGCGPCCAMSAMLDAEADAAEMDAQEVSQ